MIYLLKRTDQGGGYVASPGLKRSYTQDIDEVAVYTSKESAERDRCVGNEIIVEYPRGDQLAEMRKEG